MTKKNSPANPLPECRRAPPPTSILALALAFMVCGPVAAEDHSHHQHHPHHASPTAAGGDGHAAHQAVAPATAPAVALKLPDAGLVDQHGKARRLVSEVMDDRVVVVNFVYTTCTTVCPVASTLFSRLQGQLGERMEREVRLISISVDPARDTPARLKAYSQTYGAGPGWVWLTGPVGEVTAALKGFGTYTANYQDHPVVTLVGDPRSGQWARYFGFQEAGPLAARVGDLLSRRDGVPVTVAGKE